MKQCSFAFPNAERILVLSILSVLLSVGSASEAVFKPGLLRAMRFTGSWFRVPLKGSIRDLKGSVRV